MDRKKWWVVSNSFTLLFLVLIGGIWVYTTTRYRPDRQQLINEKHVDKHISENFPNAPIEKIPTGVFIQSLRFNSASEVNFSGYVWQIYEQTIYDGIADKDIPVGFILPEVVESASNIEPRVEYRNDIGENKEVIGWYFEATLKQKFNYRKYPFDHKVAWIRFWSNFGQGKLLVPDFSSYGDMEIQDKFGFDNDIVLGHWDLLETFFDYHGQTYNTNFGIPKVAMDITYPELYFNVVLKRRFINSFVVYILPLAIIACLTFATLMMITKDPKRESMDMSTSGVIGVCSGLFFVVLLSQVQIREQFAGTSIVYIEYFYPLMYTALLGVSINSYLFAYPNEDNNRILNWVNKEDNLHPKLLFWPLLLGSAMVITALVLLSNNTKQTKPGNTQAFLLEDQTTTTLLDGPLYKSRLPVTRFPSL